MLVGLGLGLSLSLLLELVLSLIVNVVDLVLVEALEVVGLYAVGSEHAHFSLRVLCHEVVVVRVVDLVLVLSRPQIMLSLVPLLLFHGHELVDGLRVPLVFEASLIMVLLGLPEDAVEMERLLVKQLVDLLFVFLAHRLFSNLLFAPVLLL